MYREVLSSIDNTKILAAVMPALYTQVIDILVYEMVNPRASNFTSYLSFASEDAFFGESLAQVIQKNLAQRLPQGNPNLYVKWSTDYLKSVDISMTTPPSQLENGVSKSFQPSSTHGKDTKSKINTETPEPSDMVDFTIRPWRLFKEISKINTNGRIPTVARIISSSNPSPPKLKMRINCLRCAAEGHKQRKCNANVSRLNLVYFKCNETGHISQDCNIRRTSKIRGYGRRNDTRRTQHHLFVEVSTNGNGLIMCDRDVKKGERTRTGLVV